MSNLREQIQSLAADFAAAVVKAFHGASFSDIAALTAGPAPAAPAKSKSRSRKRSRKPAAAAPAAPAAKAAAPAAKVAAAPAAKGGAKKPLKPLKRRGPAEIEKINARIVELLQKTPGGLRAEDIGKRLDLNSRELPRPLKEGVAAKKYAKKGHKRATTYFITKK
jgi:hypothetical protein